MLRTDAENQGETKYYEHLEELLPSDSGFPVHLNEIDPTSVQNKQGTHQITTITKVIREVKHFQPNYPYTKYAEMPFDPKQNLSDVSSVEFQPIDVDVNPHFIYSDLQQNEAGTQHCISNFKDPPQFSTLHDFETYPSTYSNTAVFHTKSPTFSIPQAGPQCSFQKDLKVCGLIRSQDELTGSSENVNSMKDNLALVPTLGYIQPIHFNELSEFDLNETCAIDTHYIEEPGATYGYASEANYSVNKNRCLSNDSYSPRSFLFENNRNGTKQIVSSDPRAYNEHLEFQDKFCRLNLNSLDLSANSRGIKDELLTSSNSDLCSTMRWRDPNLSEVIEFLNNPNPQIKANAAAYLQHLCYMDDPNKERTRILGGIPPLIRLLSYDVPEIHRNACGALRNLSYGRQNDENKRAIKKAGGITALVNLLYRTQESDVKELVTGVLWNLSSCEEIKRSIIDESLTALVTNIIKPHSGWDPVCPGEICYSTVFRNSSGVLRNVSSAGEYARSCLRNSEHLVECLLHVIKSAIEKNNIGNKTVENCVCVLRNLSYRCQEVEDSNYDKQINFIPSRLVSTVSKGENRGCFGTSKKKKECVQAEQHPTENSIGVNHNAECTPRSFKGYEHLWQPEIIQYYLSILQTCSNPETLEAAAGAIQNLSACYWQPSIDIRATVRKEKGLPILVELLRMEVDRVVCAVATALRNLAIDQRNKELIGKYAMRDLVQKLPSGNIQHDQNTSDDTISAVLATINEVIKKNPEFSRSLLDAGGVERLMNISKHRQKYSACVLKFASQVLFTMWQHNDLRDVYKRNGWKEQDFVQKSFTTPNSPNYANNTLNRPMASQSRTKYEDRTIQRTSKSTLKNKEDVNDSCMVPKVDNTNMGESGEQTSQRTAQNSMATVYIPIFEGGQNHAE